MKGFSFVNKNTGTYLVYSPQQGEEPDGFTLGMLSNNKIPGILPVQFVQVNNERQFIYNVTAKVSLTQYIAGSITKKRCLGVLRGIAGTVLRCTEYMLDCSSLIFEADFVFVDVSTCELSMICLPIVRGQTAVDMRQYLRELLSMMLFSEDENVEYPARLLNILNGRNAVGAQADKSRKNRPKGAAGDTGSGFSLELFIKQIDMLGEEKPEGGPVSSIGPAVKSGPAADTGMHADNDGIGPTGRLPQEYRTKKSRNKSTYNGPFTGELSEDLDLRRVSNDYFGGESDFLGPDFGTSSELDRYRGMPFRGLFGLFRRLKERQSERREPDISEDLYSAFQRYRTDGTPMSFGETTYLEGENMPEGTMVLSEESLEVTEGSVGGTAYLIRKRTDEAIKIDSDIFKIGKEKKYVDYCIENNATVSRSHADILRKENRCYIIDNNSTNHTFIDGEIIPSGKEILLEDGAEIMFGNEKFIFRCRPKDQYWYGK